MFLSLIQPPRSVTFRPAHRFLGDQRGSLYPSTLLGRSTGLTFNLFCSGSFHEQICSKDELVANVVSGRGLEFGMIRTEADTQAWVSAYSGMREDVSKAPSVHVQEDIGAGWERVQLGRREQKYSCGCNGYMMLVFLD